MWYLHKLKLRHNLRRFSTVLDTVNHVLEIRRTSCTKADSESVSDCAVPSRFDLECPDLSVLQDEQAPVPQHHPAVADQPASVHQCLREDHSSTPAEQDNQETRWYLNLTRMEKHSNCPSFCKFECHQSSSVMSESSSTCCVDSRIKQRYFLSCILVWTCVNLCTTVKKHILCTSLSPCGRHGIDCHTRELTFLFHVWIARESSDHTRCL